MKDVININSNQSSSTKNRDEAKQNIQSINSSSAADSDINDVEQQLNNTSDVDTARVAKVQSAISNGEYTVDANRIADKMLAFEDFMNK